MSELNIDATGLIAGRLASVVAKQALLGNRVRVFNCEELWLTGKRTVLIPVYRHKFKGRGKTRTGPTYSKLPDRFLRRMVRGMLPKGGTEKGRGRQALSRVECYIGVPVKFKSPSLTTVAACSVSHSNALVFTPVKILLRAIGGKI